MSIATAFTAPARALVVGGTSGIGSAIALNLAKNLPASSNITIAGRNKASAETIIASNPNVDFQPINAALMRDVKRFCSEYTASISNTSLSKVDLLVLTQGILTMQGRTPTSPENIDVKMALHYYSRMLIIRELIPILSPSAIVLSVLDGRSSDAHSNSINWNDLDLSQTGSYGIAAAARNCLAMTDATLEGFAERKGGVNRTFTHAYPGIVDTPILTKNMPIYAKLPMAFLSKVLTVSPQVCAEYLLSGVTDAKAKGRGSYNIDNKGKILTKKEAGLDKVDKVWDHTWALVDGQ